ncbi:ABC transporter ATP-binding protein [Salipiger marinus]|jgi:multiple sugar transport system ATP-binding protein|uniref:Carbohydrate ABC transporter ATP-binding protein, CUT1 family (TC 3.A.1.1.-) n=1 Tax=Salipiger marinus TaxID=555512 RepID=A0A1G8J5I5_9RHOB|nr:MULTISPECIES: sn-glycerol-3-phosphate ABC transporter ATP-binding protein UgpC [Salipiger]MCD1618476.1 sn-glycerol-3-phosphate ABC transporter ATP-binding protein UgpC [Salipiger manganoxidans]MEB3417926.1 sn-glycerol-3-phosphate ABC transporter ATP-binding protein UgpC [Salipiger manganoxidans]SDI25900.1 carbohydrate ABC transporter ATP-binding protein, CUT1 family (TC 3.A.1.1.-) [Salipiger marinus]HBS99510.1 sn-glycerol-3-phosphate ABC transporter ATP-binding protein UgpC [Citreicella sp.]
MAPILEISKLRKSYGSTEILKDINVSIDKGDFLVLVGPSGCGKSTLLNCIAGLEPITGGSILIDGQDMTHVSPKDRNIAMVFQSYALYPTMSVAKNITFGMKVRGVDQATQDRKLREVAQQLQIEAYLNRRPGQLSGGQRQRVAMGRALVRDPKLFLFDEPLSNLDAKLRVEMRSEIKKLHHRLGASIVYVTHDQIEAMTLATKIVVMKGGVIQQIGTPQEIYNRPANLFVADFMGSPAMNLIPARVRGTQVEIDRPGAAPILLSDPKVAGLPENVILGLRPEDIAEAGYRAGSDVQQAACQIDLVEPAGADTYVVSTLGGKAVTARLHTETRAAPGESLDLAFDLGKVSYFEPDSGRRLN